MADAEQQVEWYEDHHGIRPYYEPELEQIDEAILERRRAGRDVDGLVDEYCDMIADVRAALGLTT